MRNGINDCMELAETLRDVLIFLVTQIAITGTAAATFTENMRRLLERKKIITYANSYKSFLDKCSISSE